MNMYWPVLFLSFLNINPQSFFKFVTACAQEYGNTYTEEVFYSFS